jgi:hypothetical protein
MTKFFEVSLVLLSKNLRNCHPSFGLADISHAQRYKNFCGERVS